MRRAWWVLAVLGLAPGASALEAQQRSVTGSVVAARDGSPLTPATVEVVGGDETVSTDPQGNFRIQVGAGAARLRVSFFGYVTRTVDVGAGQTSIGEIPLNEDVFDLEGLVVTGQATQALRRNLANAVTSVTADELDRAPPAASAEMMLQGRVPGAMIETNSGAPGGGVQVRLRGVSTINGELEPLWVVDGMIMSNVSIASNMHELTAANGPDEDATVNRAVDLNPDDIESIEILKGASAAALYGSRAANGVIIVTTKRGRTGAPQIRLSQTVGMFQQSNKIGFRDWDADDIDRTFGPGTVELFREVGILPEGDEIPRFDYEELLAGREDLSFETNASVSGGTESTSYFVSGTWRDDAGIIESTGFEKQSLRVNLTQDLGERVRVSGQTNVVRTLASRGLSNNDNNLISYYMVLPLTPHWVDLRFDPEAESWPNHPLDIGSNPLETSSLVENDEEVWRLMSTANVEIDVLDRARHGLLASTAVGVDWFSQENEIFSPPGTEFEPLDGFDGTLLLGNADNLDLTWNTNLIYTFEGDGLGLTTTLGSQFEKRELGIARIIAQGLTAGQRNTDAGVRQTTEQTLQEVNDLGFFAQQELLALDERLLLTVGARADRSSVNGDPDRYFWYPKASASYRWDGLSSWLPGLKLRAAFGQSGNQPLWGQKFTPLAASSNVAGIPGIFIGGVTGSRDLEPERQTEIEAGFDATLLGGAGQLEATVFRKKVEDLILQRTPSLASGFAFQFFNGGEMEVEGIELALSVTPWRTGLFSWTSRTSFYHDESTITSLPVPAFETGGFGTSLGAFRIEEGASATQIVVDSGTDDDGNIVVTQVGDATPDFRMGFSNDLQIGPVRIGTLLDWSHGASVINLQNFLADLLANSPDWDDDRRERTLPDGSVETLGDGEHRAVLSDAFGDSRGYIEDGSYVKLREVSVAWDLPGGLTSSLFGGGLETVRLRASGRNLATWTDYSGLDPEVSNFGNQAIARNIDVAPFPPSRSFWLSVDLIF